MWLLIHNIYNNNAPDHLLPGSPLLPYINTCQIFQKFPPFLLCTTSLAPLQCLMLPFLPVMSFTNLLSWKSLKSRLLKIQQY